MSRFATIISTGAYLPEIERPNAAMRERFGEVIDKFEASSGIRTRFYAPDSGRHPIWRSKPANRRWSGPG